MWGFDHKARSVFPVFLILIVCLATACIGTSCHKSSDDTARENTQETIQESAPDSTQESIRENTRENTHETTQESSSESTQENLQESPRENMQDQAETVPPEFTTLEDYQEWARSVGYPQNMLVPMGLDGINQDYFHTLPDAPGYRSGRIVVGDSRCCQLGIYEQRSGGAGFADYAVWGGHFVPGADPPAVAETFLSEVEQCFRDQVRTTGRCTIYFFATVNDYDYMENDNEGSIDAAVSVAERLAAMSCEDENTVVQPEVIVIGFDGGRGDVLHRISAEDFNRYVDDYNEKLRAAVNSSALLQKNAAQFTTVPEITGGQTGFNEDGLHYSDDTLREIIDHIAEH